MHMPVVGPLSLPLPMPLHCALQLAAQHVSMPSPSFLPCGCMASQLERQACTGSPLEEPDDPLLDDEADVPPLLEEEDADPLVPLLLPLLEEAEEEAEVLLLVESLLEHPPMKSAPSPKTRQSPMIFVLPLIWPQHEGYANPGRR